LPPGCGRTDLQQGDPAQLYESVHSRLFTLPVETIVYPGRGMAPPPVASTIGEEKRGNPRLTLPLGDFVEMMGSAKAPLPKRVSSKPGRWSIRGEGREKKSLA
jgi:sulfur dioxygenase